MCSGFPIPPARINGVLVFLKRISPILGIEKEKNSKKILIDNKKKGVELASF